MYQTRRSWSPRKFYGASLLALIPFLLIFYAVIFHQEALTTLDYHLASVFYNTRTEAITPIVRAVTLIGNPFSQLALATISALALLLFSRSNYAKLLIYVMFMGALCLNTTVKFVVKRQRPDVWLHLIKQGGYSFPSGHAMGMTILFGTLIFISWRLIRSHSVRVTLAILFTLIVILVALSRIYLGVHFVSDIIGGASLGASFIFAVFGFFTKIEPHRLSYSF